MKNFWVGFFVPVLILCGVLIVNQFYPFLNLATNQVVNDPVSTSEYTIAVTTNPGTVVDYVDYDIISADDYVIETVGFNRQFVQLSIYNIETEEQLQNNSAIEIGDELQVNLAVPEGYRLNAFYVDGYFADLSQSITVTGDTTIYVDVERIAVNFVVNVSDHNDYGICGLTISSSGLVREYELDESVSCDDDTFNVITVYYGDIITFDVLPSVSGKINSLFIYGFMLPPYSGLSVGENWFELGDYSVSKSNIDEYENPFVVTVLNWYSLNIDVIFDGI